MDNGRGFPDDLTRPLLHLNSVFSVFDRNFKFAVDTPAAQACAASFQAEKLVLYVGWRMLLSCCLRNYLGEGVHTVIIRRRCMLSLVAMPAG